MNREEFLSLVRAFRWGDREWRQPDMPEVEEALDEYAREVREAALREVRESLTPYFDFNLDSFDPNALPEREDIWRIHRDLRSLLTEKEADRDN